MLYAYLIIRLSYMLLHGNNTIFSLSALYFFKTRQQLIYIFIIEINVLNRSLTDVVSQILWCFYRL